MSCYRRKDRACTTIFNFKEIKKKKRQFPGSNASVGRRPFVFFSFVVVVVVPFGRFGVKSGRDVPRRAPVHKRTESLVVEKFSEVVPATAKETKHALVHFS